MAIIYLFKNKNNNFEKKFIEERKRGVKIKSIKLQQHDSFIKLTI
jgi:hypothetical protein